ncbi:MAG TPA: FAD-dependent oxidoreductase [Methylomirabilota bacterium]|nr:FAD-dependent oxidoreductase [Methylomirabilota bacterium]
MSDPDLPPLDGTKVAVVGAGIAGLTAARKLAKAGAGVTVFEKSRGVGGRLATRRVDAAGVDHGAQYVTAREPAFKAFAARAKAEGSLAAWSPRGKDGDEEWLVGMPRMSSFVAALVDNFEVVNNRTVTGIRDDGATFTVTFDDATEIGGFGRVVVAVPGPQAFTLLEPFGAPFGRIPEARFGPCWTLMVAMADTVDPGFDVKRDIGPLAWVASSASKPGRSGNFWVAQANPTWSLEHLEETADDIEPQLLAMLEAAIGTLPERTYTAAHRWRYALVEKALGVSFLLSNDGRIGACGDWMIAPRVESAWASGGSLADAIIARGLAAAAS